jgi:hypothetical protein
MVIITKNFKSDCNWFYGCNATGTATGTATATSSETATATAT